ncbi:hypothetical protein PFDG_05140 [Plasmodium falciparum Dd2]|uniref:Uncharacterized protein n=1 Tax=Plasmodium falciparum (isolate Dd2) TaxID=57267 RepID=A0A0L7MAF4_PLAF4|nr:hypothetical protein PFDG_05140 [Plasmodium falciparum Dd2]
MYLSTFVTSSILLLLKNREKRDDNSELISNHIKERKKCNHVRIIDEKTDEGEREKNS